MGLTLLAQQDKNALKVPDGLTLLSSEHMTHGRPAISETKGSVKAILGNPTMIAAYKYTVAHKGKLFPEGSPAVKIEWVKKQNLLAQHFVEVLDTVAVAN